ncbi:MAG: sugar transferase [Clostridia bacterium]|nr:sugar transferase [Clostridia bacterium]
MYSKFWKRFLDIFLSLAAIVALSPVLLMMSVVGAFAMKGNPFFLQERTGKIDKKSGTERLFYLIKFRSMTNERDEEGNLLPGKDRLNRYGRIIRSLSLDELPSLINILIGDISIIGPRPLTMKHMPYLTEEEHHRHDVRPGLTGLAQCKGRNSLTWDEKFAYDLEYVKNISFVNDLKILWQTVMTVLKREGIGQGEQQPVSIHIERAERVQNGK